MIDSMYNCMALLQYSPLLFIKEMEGHLAAGKVSMLQRKHAWSDTFRCDRTHEHFWH